ncbi:hypothetical protein [Bradyrhizobium elkanii]|uniref:hypothetical protein n=1 Tax=Bradyrhizobium elkanii TaxID=29448 RepID=UPI0012FE2C6E|nr:hypothetical protein [Bradyrhizobium elkanii]WLA85186.1 hypothetical protein QNJ99_13745 [Bradyrhizobium elkanii]
MAFISRLAVPEVKQKNMAAGNHDSMSRGVIVLKFADDGTATLMARKIAAVTGRR